MAIFDKPEPLPDTAEGQARQMALAIMAYWGDGNPVHLDRAHDVARHTLGQPDRQQAILDRLEASPNTDYPKLGSTRP